ncbi:MAG TPA: flagella basal body P-ring formation protein FlgA [Terriglobales bacterium]
MKRGAIILALAFLLNLTSAARGQSPCGVFLANRVEVQTPDLSLADLLAPGTCPAILASASRVTLGKTPLTGSMRVIEGNEVRALLQRLLGDVSAGWMTKLAVPERVAVRRNARLSCAEIASRLFPGVQGIDCAAVDRIPREARLGIARSTWNPSTKTRDFVIRCTRPGDCVPFLVRVPDGNAAADSPAFRDQARTGATNVHRLAVAQPEILVHRGQAATVVWDQAGIRAEVTVVCLDQGREGALVRARIVHTDRILHAVVVGRGRLRIQS